MKIFSAEQIKTWDDYTIKQEPITSVDLMERAADACFSWIVEAGLQHKNFHIFCGKGNNGGDGLALAAMLSLQNKNITVYILENNKKGSADFETNLKRFQAVANEINFIQAPQAFPKIKADEIIIDALFGTGLSRPLNGLAKLLVIYLNETKAKKIAIDMPSGLFADETSINNTILKANHTLSFQNYKLAFLMPENAGFCGAISILDIGLCSSFNLKEPAVYEMMEASSFNSIYKKRSSFGHKGTYGHAALICGFMGMMGAAVLASKACLRTGAGKLTSIIPNCGYAILQTTVPEAMCKVSGEEHIEEVEDIDTYDAVGIGPGIGSFASHKKLLLTVFKNSKQLVIDADALNCLAKNKDLFKNIPANAILTPHPGEFEKLFGKTANDFEKIQLCRQMAKELNVYIILKGHFSFIAVPQGVCYFNSTGNAGMATAGSGDVLTGILTGLLAQGYSALHACLFGTYLHGFAGDLAAKNFSMEAMLAGDIIDFLGRAYLGLRSLFNE